MPADQPRSNHAAARAVVLVSGGMDSAVTLAEAKARGLWVCTLSFDYGQRHRIELDAAAKIAASLGADKRVLMPLDMRTAIGGSALTDDIPVPKHSDDATLQRAARGEIVPATYVPARNLVFLSCAVALAESIGAQEVHIGANAADYSGYPDCRPAFLEAFQACANLGTKTGVEPHTSGLRVVAPLVDMPKAEIIKRGVQLGVDLRITRSCYDPVQNTGGEWLACGVCDACAIRRAGFQAAGIPDPTRYEGGAL